MKDEEPVGRIMRVKAAAAESPASAAWLNRSTLGVGLASLFSDVSHELGTAVLPAVLLSLGAGPAALGWIEGSADALSSVAKLWGGVMTDRVTRRKPLASIGYLVTAVGVAAIGLCTSWAQVLVCRVAAWIGRGSRTAPRDVLLAEAATPATTGKAFGLERAGDALGAVIGPLIAVALLAQGVEARHVMFASLLPGLLAFLSIAFLVREAPAAFRVGPARSMLGSLSDTGKPFHRYLVAILLFGSGDFSRTLLILYATQHLTGSVFSWRTGTLAIALYVLHNAVSSLAAFPIGALTDRVSRRSVLIAGYLFAAGTTAGFALLPPTPLVLAFLFVCSGTYIACEEVVEKAYAVALLPEAARGTGLGALAAVNGIGDFVSSGLVGLLWAAFPGATAAGFFAAATLQLSGTLAILATPDVSHLQPTGGTS
jgi:MFS family permease